MTSHIFTQAEEKIILDTLKRMLFFDIELIKEEQDEKGISINDPVRETVSLKLEQFSVPFGIPERVQKKLAIFFLEKGWEFIGITSSPSVKLRRI